MERISVLETVFVCDGTGKNAVSDRSCVCGGFVCSGSDLRKKEAGAGGLDLARKVIKLVDSNAANFQPLYPNELALKDKATKIAQEIYGAKAVTFAKEASTALAKFEALGYGHLPICMAKTQYSFSDDASLIGRPEGFTLNVRNAKISAGAGFIVLLTGDIMTMPGLPKLPAAEKIDIDESGVISGLF